MTLEELQKAFDALKAENDKFKSEKETAEKEKAEKEKAEKEKSEKGKGKEEEDTDLGDKVRKEREAKDKSKSETQKLESALKFNMGVGEFVKNNEAILPSEMPGIIEQAEKEKYDTAGEKATAIRVALIKEFFNVQANLDLLTDNQKTKLEDYFKLSKTGREEKSESIFENIFEPAITMLGKLKKAEELGKSNSGFASNGKVEDNYTKRLIQGSKKNYLGEKETK